MLAGTRLTDSFYRRKDVVQVARDLLGKQLHVLRDGAYTAATIVETEAYRAPEDKASHAYNNRRTTRTEIMFGAPGTAYVYLCYGIHHLFNVVTGPEEVAHAVLIRAVEPAVGIAEMLERRSMKNLSYRLTSGPGSLTCAMGISVNDTGMSLTEASSPIWISEADVSSADFEVVESPRVGVGYAEECAAWPWRFRIAGNKWTSPAK